MSGMIRRTLSALLVLCLLSTLLLPAGVFADETTEPSAAIRETEAPEAALVETEPAQTEPEPVTEPEPAPETTEQSDPEASGGVEVTAVSRTKNFVGEVFTKMFDDSEENRQAREAALAKYPRDHHELSYYGDSLRVRYLKNEAGEASNYLVYRDSFLIFSQEDSLEYQITYSEDQTTAYVSPAIPSELLEEKTGIVFLSENIGCDVILVFDGKPESGEDALAVPLKDVRDITITELFSDGKLEYSGDSGEPRRLDVGFTIYPKGTNWKGQITSFQPYWPKAHVEVDVWDLEFKLLLDLRFDLGFEIETTGSSGGRETAKIASVSVPLDLFDIGVQYNLQVEFPDAPLKIKGTSKTEMEITMDLLFGTRISKFRNPITLSDLTVKNPADYNKDIPFYIGSQILIYGGFLELSIDLWLFSVDIGPVLSINIDNSAGCYGVARHEKDSFSEADIGQKNRIHTCTAEGEPGCITVDLREVSRYWIYFKVDLYFDHWEFPLYDPGEKTVSEYSCYNSLTHNSGMKAGYCPHLFYKVPVRVWLDDNMTHPAAGMPVTVSDSLQISAAEERITSSVTDSGGAANIYLPYRERYQYTFLSSGVIDGRTLAGSAKQPHYIRTDENSVVNIILHSDETVRIQTDIVWDVDFEQKDVPSDPYSSLGIQLQRREAGTENEWEWCDNFYRTTSSVGWSVEEWQVPKFGFEGTRAYLYEYRVRILETRGTFDYVVITPEANNCYITRGVDAYTDVVGSAVQSHANKYLINYDEKTTDEAVKTTITATAVMDIRLNKSWRLSDPANKAESVYLALLQKPAEGWGNKADEKHVPKDWVVILDPITGTCETISSLESAEVLTLWDDLSSIENRRLAIGKVNDGNDWTLNYTVRKYRNGIRLQYEGYELDKTVIENLLAHEYDIHASVSVKSFGNYLSLPGTTTEENDYARNAVVVNTDPIPDNTLSGTIYWQYAVYGYAPTDYVVLHIRKNGVPIKDLTVNKADCAVREDLWFWQLTLEDYDPDAEYTITETIPFGPDGPDWVGVPFGLNLINYYIWYDYVQAEGQAIFDVEPEGINEVTLYAEDYSTGTPGWSFTVKKSNGWWDRNADRKKTEVAPIENYIIEAGRLPNYSTVYGLPFEYTRPNWGNLFYNFTVYYLRNSDHLKLHIEKEWEDDGSAVYPDRVAVEVFRDDEKIAETTLFRTSGGWSSATITKDMSGNDLTRTYYDQAEHKLHKYVYTIREKPVDGFTSKVEVTGDTGDDIYYTLTNTWVGADYVNVAGTVTWEEDEGKEYVRPENVQISVVNSKEEFVKSITVPVSGDGRFEAKYLPGRDADGQQLTYSVMESHVTGYTTTYSTPTFNAETRTWTCDVTNKLTGYYPITVKKTVECKPEDADDEEYRFTVAAKNGIVNVDHEFPAPLQSELTITGAGETKAEFLLDVDGLYLYSFKEVKGETEDCVYDEEEKFALIFRKTEDNGAVTFKSWVGVSGKENPAPKDENASDTVEFINRFPGITVEKKWDIDLEKKDRPDSIEAVIQKKKDDKWENVKLIELKEDNNWKVKVSLPLGEDDEYRVRELKEETALQEMIRTLKETLIQFSTDTYDSWLSQFKSAAGEYYNMLPDFVRNAADQGADKLKEALKAKEEDVLDKLIELIGLASAMDRVVYDEDDSDKPGGSKGDDEDEEAKTNEVTFHVEEKQSLVSGGTVDAHVTKYKVSYSKEGDTYTIENKAILDIDVIKRWLSIGVEDDDMPDSAWVVLLCKPAADIGENSAAGAIAGAAGVDLGDLLDFEFPIINPEDGGMDPINIISQLILGVDLNIFSGLDIIPKLSIGKATEDNDWTVSFVVSKYVCGIPMEYKGAELGSEIIRQIVKYLTGVDFFISYNPFDNYFSIPTKAIRTIAGITDPGDLLDFSKLAGKLLEKAKSLTMDDIKNFGPETMLDDWHLMANVINVKIDFDLDTDDSLSGTKTWKDDEEENRPDSLLIHIKDGDRELEGSPITLNKSDFAGDSEWTWELELPEDSEIDPDDCIVSEEYPADYEYKDHYTCETDGLNLINTWHDEEPETVRIFGKKIWKDQNDQDGIRPDTITIRLLADGEEVASVETSKQGEWKYVFAEQPRYKTVENEETGASERVAIVYTLAEDEVEGYEAAYEDYNVINTRQREGILVLTAVRSAEEAEKEQAYVYRISDESGREILTAAVILEAGETENSVRISVPAGMYRITEESPWSWRWQGSLTSAILRTAQTGQSGANALFGEQIRVAGGGETEVTYSYTQEVFEWLNGCAHRQEDAAPPPAPGTGPDAAAPEKKRKTDEDG